MSGQLQTPAALPAGETAPGTHCTGSWVGPTAGLVVMPAGNQIPAVQPVAIPTELSRLLKQVVRVVIKGL
jgi:hypothetical protein